MNTAKAAEAKMKSNDFLTLLDYSPAEINQLLQEAIILKNKKLQNDSALPLKGKVLGMIFEKSSTRTRVSFETGMLQLGGHALYLNSNDLQIGRGETVADTAKVLSRYVDGIMIRTFSHKMVEELAENADIPVINGLTDKYHPCQAIADLLTIVEKKGELKGLQLTYIGDGNNVAHSLMVACAKMGMEFSIAAPEGYHPDKDVVSLCEEIASQTGGKITITTDPVSAATGADILYTDVWTSMGQEAENAKRIEVFQNYQINEDLVQYAKEDFLFMHCLPAHRGEEVSAGVMDGSHSVVFDQAENRLHAQKALLVQLLG